MEVTQVKEFAESLIQEYCPQYKFQFSNGKRVHGFCNYSKRVIAVSLPYIRAANQDQIFNTITHEIAHAIAGRGEGHGLRWKMIHKSLGGDGKRCSEVNVTEDAKYIETCVNKCFERGRFRKPKYPISMYRCKKCKGNIELKPI